MTELTKYSARRIAEFKYPLLIICEGKHQTDYSIVLSEPGFWKACVGIVKGRVESGYLKAPGKPAGLYDCLPAEQVAALPAPYKQEEEKKLRYNKSILATHKCDEENWDMVQLAIKGDGKAAYIVLDSRGGYEYESFEICNPVVYE
jgi:hypothetical protein